MAETERLLLRRFVVGDAPFILRLLNEPAFLRFIGDRGVRTREDARAYLERVPLESYRKLGFGLYLVELKPDRIPIGMCGLMRKPWLKAPDLAYAFLAEYGGRGYASEAARAVLDHAWVTLELERVVAVVQPENAASVRLLEKLGFTSQGTVTDPAGGAELELHSRSRESEIMRTVSLTLCTLIGWTSMTVPVEAQQIRRTLVAVFAHPDDERIVAPLLARYAREGHDVYLVIATDGGKGVREHAGVPAGESLANARAEEARCAARELSIHPPILLGLEDAGLASFASLGRLREGARRVFGVVDPDVIISFGPEGGTGHPDHRLVGAVVTEVVQGGGEGIPDALYYPSLPAERMKQAPPARPEVTAIPQKHLAVSVPFAREDLEAAHRAFACHHTQYTRAEMDAILRYLEHGFDGAVHLRPWDGAQRRPDLFE